MQTRRRTPPQSRDRAPVKPLKNLSGGLGTHLTTRLRNPIHDYVKPDLSQIVYERVMGDVQFGPLYPNWSMFKNVVRERFRADKRKRNQ